MSAQGYKGRAMPAREAPALLRGAGLFTDDVPLERALAMAVLRSPGPAGRIVALEIGAATARPGVVAVFTGKDVAGLGRLPVNPVLPLDAPTDYPLLAQGHVAAVGQPVAAVLAETPAAAQDALDDIGFDVDDTPPLPADQPLTGAHWQAGDATAALADAAVVIEAEIAHPLLAPSPMEPRAAAVRYEPEEDRVTLWQSTQTPHRTRAALAAILGCAAGRVRVIAPNVGGAFGMKGSVYPEEVLAVWSAFRLKRSVRWTATRSDEFLSATHGRGTASRGWLGLDGTGRFLALRAEVTSPLGHWVPNSGLITGWNAARVLPSGYDIPHLDISTRVCLTPRPPRGIYRGAGRPEANLLIETLIARAATVTGQDPVDLRRRNLLAAGRLPHDTATGNRLDSGDYAAALDALETSGAYRDALAWRDDARATGALAGVGVAFYVEPSGEGWESARVTLGKDGRVQVDSGSSGQGQGRGTAYSQIAADALGVACEAVTVQCGDTGVCPEGIGALASRSTAIGGSAVHVACQKIAQRREAGEPAPITAETRYETKGQAWGYGACLVRLSVDRDTGQPQIHRLDLVDDCGTVINPAQVEGQLLGGLAQGIGEALSEAVVFDADGQLLTGSFMDYAMPRALDIPPVSLTKIETPSPLNALGAKGVGEAGTIAAPPAILNAALDALGPLGVRDLTMPLTACTLWQAMEDAKREPK